VQQTCQLAVKVSWCASRHKVWQTHNDVDSDDSDEATHDAGQVKELLVRSIKAVTKLIEDFTQIIAAFSPQINAIAIDSPEMVHGEVASTFRSHVMKEIGAVTLINLLNEKEEIAYPVLQLIN